jgi:hypothetical protein
MREKEKEKLMCEIEEAERPQQQQDPNKLQH